MLRRPLRHWVGVLTIALGTVQIALPGLVAAEGVQSAAEIERQLRGIPARPIHTPVPEPVDTASPPIHDPGPTQETIEQDSPAPAIATIDLTIHFATGSATIRPESIRQLREIATALRALNLGASKILIVGHADSRGSASYNLDLSDRRARSVRNTLAQDFEIPSDWLEARGRGESEPKVSPERTSEDYAVNRRVELIRLP